MPIWSIYHKNRLQWNNELRLRRDICEPISEDQHQNVMILDDLRIQLAIRLASETV